MTKKSAKMMLKIMTMTWFENGNSTEALADDPLMRAVTSLENVMTTGTEALRGGIPESSATTTIWASLLFNLLKDENSSLHQNSLIIINYI